MNGIGDGAFEGHIRNSSQPVKETIMGTTVRTKETDDGLKLLNWGGHARLGHR